MGSSPTGSKSGGQTRRSMAKIPTKIPTGDGGGRGGWGAPARIQERQRRHQRQGGCERRGAGGRQGRCGVMNCLFRLYQLEKRGSLPPWLQQHVAGEDRAHDLRIMRPTRFQLRYCRSWQRCFAIPNARRAWAYAARGGVGRGHGNTGGLDSASRTGGLPQRHGRLLRSPSSSAPPQYD